MAKDSAELFKILAADTRLEIIELLKAGPQRVNDIAATLGVSQSAVSQHLRILKQAALVRGEREGYYIPYSLNEEALHECRQRLEEVCTCGCVEDHFPGRYGPLPPSK
ncbi:MAG: ArsR/SmtB family transcription factor, partial [Anaerolineae bacterium]